MKNILVVCGILALLTLLAHAMANEPRKETAKIVEIPLKDIWAYQMPGTRDARELEPDKFGPQIRKLSTAEQLRITDKSLMNQIGTQLQHDKPGQSARQAFAVARTGVDALREAAAVLSGKKKPQASFGANTNVSLVFFSYSSGYYVYLNKVELQPGLVVISYRFVPHETKEMTSHFALIPLGRLQPGEVKVDIKRSPWEKKFLDAGFKEPPGSVETQIVSRSFRFTVKDEGG
jgi:hypothetical protein